MGCGDARALKTGISRRSGAGLDGFLDFEAPDYSPEATENFRRLLDDEDYINEIRAYSAFDGGALVGMLATRWGRNHIAIFVDGKYHRRGIGKALFALAVMDNSSGKMTVNSSSYALQVYMRLGFRPICSEAISGGIRFTHMETEILDIAGENRICTGEVVHRGKAPDPSCISGAGARTECYDISSAGHIPDGVDFIPSAIRELNEELGVRASPHELIFCGNPWCSR